MDSINSSNNLLKIGFLSRIHPKKGLDILIKALSGVNFPYKLLIAGGGEESYIKSLNELAKDCGNNSNIEWVGWKNGEEKFEFLSQLDLFALTSHSENFAIVVIESLSVGTPVLISNQIGLYKYVLQNDCGWVSDLDIEHITKQLNDLYADKEKLEKIKKLAPALIKHDYEELNLTNQYVQFYQEIK